MKCSVYTPHRVSATSNRKEYTMAPSENLFIHYMNRRETRTWVMLCSTPTHICTHKRPTADGLLSEAAPLSRVCTTITKSLRKLSLPWKRMGEWSYTSTHSKTHKLPPFYLRHPFVRSVGGPYGWCKHGDEHKNPNFTGNRTCRYYATSTWKRGSLRCIGSSSDSEGEHLQRFLTFFGPVIKSCLQTRNGKI